MENKSKYSFQKLWHLLLDKNMTKKELAESAKISVSSMSRLRKGIPLSYDRMQRICKVVGVNDVKDIMDEV